MDRSEWDDEGEYPSAPVPAHERGWRHPSEVGAQQWAHSEPPLAIGRGLTAATGAVGILLAIAVLWTMLPTRAGRSAGVSVRSTVDAVAASIVSSSLVATTGPRDTEPPATTKAPTVVSTVVTTAPPVPTYHLATTTPAPDVALAVAVNDGQLLLTTANAVSTDSSVELIGLDGEVHQAHVLVVDQRSGLAVLAPEATTETPSFAVASDLQPGDTLVVHGGDAVVATVGADGATPVDLAPGTDVQEGTPVVNDRGELVGLCTHGPDGMTLVPVGNLADLRRALGSTVTPPVRMGVVLNDDPEGDLTVAAIEPNGPAALAGLDVGDTIVAVDGERINGVDDLAGLLALHHPGDVILVDLLCADGTALVVSLVLAAPKPSI